MLCCKIVSELVMGLASNLKKIHAKPLFGKNARSMDNANSFAYLVNGAKDELWGIIVDNVGETYIAPGYKRYPPLVGHPDNYYFLPEKGRVLDNYQLIYVSKGSGVYYSSPYEQMKIKEGDLFIIPPYTWHSYFPDRKTGWQEYWIGLRGAGVDDKFKNGFVKSNQIVFHVGLREDIIDYYKNAIEIAAQQRAGYLQVLAALANNILALSIYYDQNIRLQDAYIMQMDKARIIMRESYLKEISPQDVARQLNMGYSRFRKVFKEYTGESPAHYIIQLKLKRARHLLINSTMSVKEIAYSLQYKDAFNFSSQFKKYTGYSPSEFREEFSRCKNISIRS